MFFRSYICGVDEARLYVPCHKPDSHQPSADTAADGGKPDQAT